VLWWFIQGGGGGRKTREEGMTTGGQEALGRNLHLKAASQLKSGIREGLLQPTEALTDRVVLL